MKFEKELIRGAAPLAVLKLLERRAMYGYELVEELSARTSGVLTLGQSTLYPLLYNLEGKGLVESFWEEADSGRERKYYRLTGAGKKRLAADAQQWLALSGALAGLGLRGGHSSPVPSLLSGDGR